MTIGSWMSAALGAMLLAAALLSLHDDAVAAKPGGKTKIRVLVVVGGHDFEREPFLAMFRSIPDIEFELAEHPKAHERLSADAARRFDVVVFYDMWPEIADPAKNDFIRLFRKDGKGLVALHHSICGYPSWDEYARIIGGRYHNAAWRSGGVEKPASTYLHDVRFRVNVVDPKHPVTRGITDFDIVDETYKDFEVLPGVKPLLRTDEKTSGPVVAWAKEYGKARVATIQLGHDHQAYENDGYRRLVANAIRWTARREN